MIDESCKDSNMITTPAPSSDIDTYTDTLDCLLFH